LSIGLSPSDYDDVVRQATVVAGLQLPINQLTAACVFNYGPGLLRMKERVINPL